MKLQMSAVRGFERLDQQYLDDLVARAQLGDSNAFAELFACTADRQLYYIMRICGDRQSALGTLSEVYVKVMRELPYLPDRMLIIPWMLRIATAAMIRLPGMEGDSGRSRDYLPRLLGLPLLESQTLIMTRHYGLSLPETAELLNISRRSVKRFIKLGRRHLQRYGDDGYRASADAPGNAAAPEPKRMHDLQYTHLSPLEAAHILEEVYDACGREPNTLPMEALSSYAVYRSERFSLQRGILTAALAIFLMLPVLFLMPEYSLSMEESGARGLPVYTVEVKSLLPARKVTASIRSHRLPVYEAAAREYTIEPTRNGTLSITLELVNRQKVSGTYEVTAVDSDSPRLAGTDTDDEYLVIHAEDAGIGVDYREIYAISSSGEVIHPMRADEEGIVFEYPSESWDIYIPDHIGNTLHLAIRLK